MLDLDLDLDEADARVALHLDALSTITSKGCPSAARCICTATSSRI